MSYPTVVGNQSSCRLCSARQNRPNPSAKSFRGSVATANGNAGRFWGRPTPPFDAEVPRPHPTFHDFDNPKYLILTVPPLTPLTPAAFDDRNSRRSLITRVTMSTGSHSAQSHNVAKKAKGGYTRQRRGCLTCRQRKKKCDQASPLCGHCLRLNLVCKREPPRELHKPDVWGEDDVEAGRALTFPSASGIPTSRRSGKNIDEPPRPSICDPLDLFIPTVFGGKDPSTNRRSMMRYYTSTLANMLSATWENNCFLSGASHSLWTRLLPHLSFKSLR